MYAWLQNLFDENTHGDALSIPNKTLFLSCNVNHRAHVSSRHFSPHSLSLLSSPHRLVCSAHKAIRASPNQARDTKRKGYFITEARKTAKDPKFAYPKVRHPTTRVKTSFKAKRDRIIQKLTAHDVVNVHILEKRARAAKAEKEAAIQAAKEAAE
jgi:hypothetical protein